MTMMVRINVSPQDIRDRYVGASREFVRHYNGKLIEVDTDNLRLEYFYLKSEGMRIGTGERIARSVILDIRHASEIINDVRLGLSMCRSCGKVMLTNNNMGCCGTVVEFIPGSSRAISYEKKITDLVESIFYPPNW